MNKYVVALTMLTSLSFAQASYGQTAAESQDNVLSVELLSELNQVHNLAVSPDGKRIVYGIKEGIRGTENHLYLQQVGSKKAQQLTSHANGESSVAFAKDGKSIYFLSNRSGSRQVWQLPLTGGEALQVTKLPLPINGFKVANDGNTFAFDISVKPGCLDFACTISAQHTEKNKKSNALIYDQLMVRHWDTWGTAFKSHLFIAKRDGGVITNAEDVISDWQGDIVGMSELSFHPDGNSLVFSAKQPGKDVAWTTNFDLFEYNISAKKLTNITEDNKAWDANPVFSNNGRYLAYTAMNTPVYESDKFSIKVRDNNTGQVRSIASQFDRSVSELIFADDNRTLYVTAQDLGQKSIFEIHPEFGDVRTVYNDGISSNISVVGDKIFFARHDLDSPKDIYVINRDGYELQQLTQVNKAKLANINMAEFSQFSFKGANDDDVYGYWLKPANYQAGETYPIAFLVHGGPQGSFGNMFHYRWNAQLWAAQGYGVVMIDFHGSTGYGQAFTDSITNDWGGKPLEDLKKGMAHIVKAQPWLDQSRACALGASYGGYMMNWIQSQWSDGFKCIVNHAGLFDMPSFYTSTEELWFPEHDFGGTLWDKEEAYQRFNPAAFVNKWKTPMLVTQGQLDFRVPYAQSLGAFTTLQRQNIDSRLVMFPKEDHHILNPDNLQLWYHEVFTWLNKYTSTTTHVAE